MLKKKSSKLSPNQLETIKKYLSDEIKKELSSVPKIAIIGNAGVGKTSTINALFGTDLPISHVEACTKQEVEISLGEQVKGASGEIKIFDMPGLGEDIEADEDHKVLYRKIISECDVAVWILAATYRAIAFDQQMIRDVVAPANIDLVKRLVIGINQIGLLQPGSWIPELNMPSLEQKESIKARISDIQSKLVKVVPGLTLERIIPYSALKRFQLQHLFEAMLNAYSDDRAWVLNSRGSVADYRELIDPKILQMIEDRKKRK